MTDAREALDRVWLVMESLAVAHPGMTLKEGVILGQKIYAEVDWLLREGITTRPAPDGDGMPAAVDPETLGKWAGRHKDVTDLILDGKKINAIKELRAKSLAGLKEAKEAVEWLAENPQWISGKI